MGKKKASSRGVNGHTSKKQAKSEKIAKKDVVGHNSIEDLITKVEQSMEIFNFESAETFCEQALEASPDNQRALNLAASVFLEIGKNEKAADCIRHAIDIEQEKGYSKFMMLGQLLEGEEAAECFKKGIQLMIKEKQLIEKGKSSEVNSTNTAAEEITNRDVSNAFCSLAEIFLTDCWLTPNAQLIVVIVNVVNNFLITENVVTTGKYQTAEILIVRTQPRWRGLCMKDRESAETSCKEYCEKAIEHDPSNPEAYQVLANFLLSEEKNEEAKQMLSKSLDLLRAGEDSSLKGTPPSYESRISLSKMLIEVEEFDNACNVLEGLLMEDDEVVQVWYLLGWIYHLSGQDTAAVKYYLERAKKLFTQTECDDVPLLEHIKELLLEISENNTSNENQESDDENAGEEKGINEDKDDEEMDTIT